MNESVVIDRHYNGPPDSGNGGYSCGVLAAFIDGPARVRLHVPPPLDTPLTISARGDGQVDMCDGETVVGSAWPATLDMDIPPPPSLATAREASHGYLGFTDHNFPSCYVCGPDRKADGMCLFPGPVDDWNLLACTWTPRDSELDETGHVQHEIIWAALDCPGFFGACGERYPPSSPTVLGELTGEIYAAVPGGVELVVYCWPLGVEGRKSWGGTAIVDSNGQLMAASKSLWISLK